MVVVEYYIDNNGGIGLRITWIKRGAWSTRMVHLAISSCSTSMYSTIGYARRQYQQ